MKTLTKDQLQCMPPADQETYGLSIARDLERRLDLIRLARPSRWTHVVEGLGYFVIVGAVVYPGWRYSAAAAVIVMLTLMQWHTSRIHRRLDAMAELLESEIVAAGRHTLPHALQSPNPASRFNSP